MQDWQRLVGENLVYTAIVDEDLIRQAAIIIINDRMCLPSSMYHFSSPLLLSLLHILPLFSFHYCIFFPSSPFITTYSSPLLPFHYAYFSPLLLSLLHISLVGRSSEFNWWPIWFLFVLLCILLFRPIGFHLHKLIAKICVFPVDSDLWVAQYSIIFNDKHVM